MKQKLGMVLVLCLLMLLPITNAQTLPDLTQQVGTLLQNGQFDLARQQLESYLLSQPEAVDAWVMQGQVILNETQASEGERFVFQDESIFHRWNGLVDRAPLLIPQPIATQVAGLWQKGLELDPLREDLREGLAYLYVQALMKPELLAELTNLKNLFPDSRELKYVMCDLARGLAERNALADACEVYQLIMEFYPHEPVVYAAFAETLLAHGRSGEAGKVLELAATLSGPDKQRLYQVAFQYWTILGEYAKAQSALQAWSQLTHRRDSQFYQGLLMYYNNNPKWLAEMRRFLSAPYDQVDGVQRALAEFLVAPANRHDFPSYQRSLAFKIDSGMALLLHKRAIRKFPNQAEPYLKAGEYYNANHYYDAALRLLRLAEPKAVGNPAVGEQINLQYAWALQNGSEPASASQSWIKLFNAKDFFVKSAAVYFFGKNLWTAGQHQEAVRFFKMIAGRETHSKYAFYSKKMLQLPVEQLPADPQSAVPDGAAL